MRETLRNSERQGEEVGKRLDVRERKKPGGEVGVDGDSIGGGRGPEI